MSQEYDTTKHAKAIAHACMMVFAWLYLVPTGIILARYYRNLFPSLKFLKVAFWLNAHRSIMIFTLMISITAFILVLADKGWKWIEADERVAFAHSIFGIVTIGILIFQMIIGFIRPNKNAPFRKLFNWFHRSSGIILILLAITTCFLGVCIEELGLKNVGWGLMLGWSLWIIIFIIAIESVQYCYRNENTYVESNGKYENESQVDGMLASIKIWFLVLHLIASLAFVVALMTMIGIKKPI